MGDPVPVDHWTHSVSLIPGGGADVPPSEGVIARLVADRRANGWELVSTETKGDGSRALRFRRADVDLPQHSLHG